MIVNLDELQTAYNTAAYSVTKAILTPVMEAVTDSLSDAISRGVRDALNNSTVSMWDFLIGKKKVN